MNALFRSPETGDGAAVGELTQIRLRDRAFCQYVWQDCTFRVDRPTALGNVGNRG
jgi:hypothetical protein